MQQCKPLALFAGTGGLFPIVPLKLKAKCFWVLHPQCKTLSLFKALEANTLPALL